MRHFAALGPDIVDRVLDDVQRRRFLVHPAREDALKLILRVANVELHKGPGQFLHLPRSSRLAGAKPNGDVAGANRLTRLQLDLTRDTVALVEQPKHRNSLRHRRRTGRNGGHRLRNVHRARLGFVLLIALHLLGGAVLLPAGGKREQEGKAAGTEKAAAHPWSGVQAS